MVYSFNAYTLDTECRELRHAGVPVKLQRKVYQMLVYLVQQRRRVVTRDEILEHVWPEAYVDDSAVARCVRAVRRAIGDRRETQHMIQTFHGQGYRFVASVVEHITVPEVDPHPPPGSVSSPDALASRSSSAASLATAAGRSCGTCRQHHPDTARFCADCGSALALDCPHCQQAVRLPATFCPACGHLLDLPATPSLLASLPAQATLAESMLADIVHLSIMSSPVVGERKLVTVLCGVLSLALPLIPAVDLDDQHALIAALEGLVCDAMQPYDGSLYQLADDRFTVVFGAPQAQEDHARRAVMVALALQRQWPAFVAAQSLAPAASLGLGLGMHTSAAAVGVRQEKCATRLVVVGEAPLLATYLAQQARSGTILLSGTTARQAPAVTSFETLLPLHVPGPSAPIEVYRAAVTATAPGAPPPRWEYLRSRFVGRQAEMAVLHAGLTRARNGQGQVIGIIGEAGMGKSRLLAEFRREVTQQPLTYLAANCESYGRYTLYRPLRALVQQLCGLDDADDIATCNTKLHARLHALDLAPDECSPFLLDLLGVLDDTSFVSELSPQVRRRRTFEALYQLLLRSSQRQPVVVELENLHWIDATSKGCLGALVARLTHHPILLLLSYRPGYQPSWAATSIAMQLSLASLTRYDSQRVVEGILNWRRVSAIVLEHIVTQAQGNPLFLEELAQAIREQGTETPSQAIP